MEKLFWKFKYARHLKKKLDLTMMQALQSAEAALEQVDYDLNEDPVEMAQEEVFCWAADHCHNADER